MSVSSTPEQKDTATTSRTRSQKSAKTKQEKTMPADSVETKDSQDTNNGSQLLVLPDRESSDASALVPLPGLLDRPIGPNSFEISETFVSAGIRPVEASHHKVIETVNMSGIRPIMSSDLQIIHTINFSGIRPVTASTLNITETMLSSGLRPIASNDIDSGVDMMGFLD
ncbi:hypothetical protein [Argonema antarcticum]|uniref:hypothetical protein n=1 Tax=Argonema antarcticum TaxID=2942763 RepID=UPI0020115FDC|nr:hypothetical protein [Argonema antarcticum]MCL1471585.1 hypothetical protein [Argonema antarcticum A004/B2]